MYRTSWEEVGGDWGLLRAEKRGLWCLTENRRLF